MKILVLANINFNKPYGTHTRPFYISKYLRQMGQEILILGIKGNQKSGFLKFKELKSLQLECPLKYLLTIREIFFNINSFKPDIIYAHSNIFTIIAKLLRGILILKTPIVFDKHGSWALEQTHSFIYPILKYFEAIALRCADVVVAASYDLMQSLIKIYKIPSKKFTVVPNGVDLTIFYPLPINDTKILGNGLYKDKNILIFTAPRNFISNIIAIKFMYRVMDQLYKKDSRVILLITGGGPIIKPKPNNVKYTGLVEDLNLYLNLAEIAVMPYPKEAPCGGARNKVLEYFACKIPVVSTMEGIYEINGALPDIHFIYAKDDHIDFAKKILIALKMNEKERLEMIEKSYSLISTDYSWENQAKKISRIFDSLIY